MLGSVLSLTLCYLQFTDAALSFNFKPNNLGRLMKRDDYDKVDFEGSSTAAPIVDFYFGSENQKISIILDTGSFTSFVQSKAVSDDQGFDYQKSSTYKNDEEDYSVLYADSTGYKSNWSEDSVAFADGGDSFTLKFGLATEATTNGVSSDTNVFGLGFDYDQPTLLDQLSDKNLISRKSFAIYSSANDHSLGEITFGGVDTAKYSGDLVSVPLRDSSNGYVWWSYLTDLTANCESATAENIYQISFDCGYTTGLTVPDAVRTKILNNLDAYYESSSDNYVFDCDKANIGVEVAGHTINIPPSAITKKVKDSDKCVLQNINKGSDDDSITFGWVFFPYIYGVFDAENKEILFGKPNTDTSDSNVQEVSDSIPGSKQASKYSSVSEAVTTNSISTSSISTSSTSLDLDSTGVSSIDSCSASDKKRFVKRDSISSVTTSMTSSSSNSTYNGSSAAPVSEYEAGSPVLLQTNIVLALVSFVLLLA